MSILSKDTFTGGDDSDITGRTPDGGGNPAYANGLWQKHGDYPTGRIDIESGKLRAHLNQNAAYVIKNLDTTANYKTQATFRVLDFDTSAYVGVGLRSNDVEQGQHYFFMYYQDNSLIWDPDIENWVYAAWIEIWWQVDWFNYDFIGGHSIPAIGGGISPTITPTNFTMALQAEGTTLKAYLNDVEVISEIDTNISAIGYPVIWMDNGNSTDSWECWEYTVESLGAEPPAGSTRSFATWI